MWVIFFSDLCSTVLALQGCWTVHSQLLHSTKQNPVLLREDIASFSTKKLTLTGENSLSQLLTFHALISLCIHFTLLSQSKQYFFFLIKGGSLKFLGTLLCVTSCIFRLFALHWLLTFSSKPTHLSPILNKTKNLSLI